MASVFGIIIMVWGILAIWALGPLKVLALAGGARGLSAGIPAKHRYGIGTHITTNP